MAIDPDHLTAYEIPEVRQYYSERDCALYALSLGMGHDPLDRGALRFVGGDGDVVPFPTMALVLGHPGFWLGRPDTGVDPVRVVHGEQSIELLRPLKASGTVHGKTRVVGLVDKGEGRGALLYTKKELTTDTGEPVAITRSTTVLRGDGGFGRSTMSPPPPVELPSCAPDIVTRIDTRPEQALIYRWNGDNNPLHVNPDVAKKAGYERPILHGLCTFGIAALAVVKSALGWHGELLRSIGGRFSAPVYPGAALEVLLWKTGSFQVRQASDAKVVLNNGFYTCL